LEDTGFTLWWVTLTLSTTATRTQSRL
jgi:hypothetical protein